MMTIEDLKINIDNCVKYIKDKYGEQEDLSPAQWLTLIAEEFGEFAQEINDNNLGNNFIEEGCQYVQLLYVLWSKYLIIQLRLWIRNL